MAKNIDKEIVDESIDVLSKNVDDLNQGASTFFFEPTDMVYGKLASGDEEDLRSVAGSIAKHIRIVPSPRVSYEWGVKMNLEVAGQFAMTEVSRIIRIPFFYMGKEYSTGAILAHEMTHAFLAYRGIILDDPEKNEVFTDIATIYIGLGKLMINCLFRERNKHNGAVYSLGYLPHDLALYCYVSVSASRDIPNDIVVRNLTLDARKMIANDWENYR